ncbi:MAG: M20/M25/M40 family metallo-hydrolase [Clostridia bacterium]|nr:M20/M25/M40 family metallo-hydrolase [Clostridia bacterium]
MKKILLVAIALLLVVACMPTTILAEQTTDDYKNSPTYKMLEEFVTACPNRQGQEGEYDAAAYIHGKFTQYYVESDTTLELPTMQPIVADGYYGNNVILHKDNKSTTDSIVIGAHYDSVGVGANDNASGIVALLQIVQELKEVKLPFDVYFVAFGGEEQGLLGSQAFVNNFSQEYKLPLTSIRVMFNLDSIANGDNLYVQCENKSTSLANLILQNATGKTQLLEKPHAVGVFNADMWGYGYYEVIQGSDHTPFRVAGVPVASFFSGNFQNWTYVESANSKNNTMNTAMDKLENCNQSWIDKIDTVVDTIVSTVVHGDFASVSQNARKELLNLDLWYNRLWPKIVAVVIVILLAVFAVLHNRKLQKQALMGTASANTSHIFETPSADDIFSFKD